jgi:hypothetical protein
VTVVADHQLTLDLLKPGPRWACTCEDTSEGPRWHYARTASGACDDWMAHYMGPQLAAHVEAEIEALRDRGLL